MYNIYEQLCLCNQCRNNTEYSVSNRCSELSEVRDAVSVVEVKHISHVWYFLVSKLSVEQAEEHPKEHSVWNWKKYYKNLFTFINFCKVLIYLEMCSQF